MVKGKDQDYPEFKASFAKISKAAFSKKQIMVFIDSSFYGFSREGVIMRDHQMRQIGFFNRRTYLMEKNIQTRDIQELINLNLEFVNEKKELKHKYILNKFNLTNSFSIKNWGKILKNPKQIRLKNLNLSMVEDKTLHQMIRGSAEENYNFIWFDYINQQQIIVDFLIGLNFEHKLVISRATLYISGKEIQALDICTKLIKRNNSLFIVDFKKDFDIDFEIPFANFEVDYQFGKDHLGFKGTDKVNIKEGDCYLLNFPKIISQFM